MPIHPKLVARTVRIDAELWAAARTKARTKGETVSAVVRRALKRYAGTR